MPVLIGREKVSPSMQSALLQHITYEREKRKQEAAEAEKHFERKAREEEEKRKKIEEDHSTLEDIKEQLNKLKEKQDRLKQEKHQLFWQFRKVLNEEAKQKAARMHEQSESGLATGLPYSHPTMPVNAHHMLPPAYRFQGQLQPSPYLHAQHPVQQGLKRPHSPSAPATGNAQSRPPSMQSSPLHTRVQGPFPTLHPPTDRPTATQQSYASAIGKPNEQSPHLDDRSRPRISLLQSSQSSPFSSSFPSRSDSPGRFNVKTEKDHVSYSPNSSSTFPVQKYQQRSAHLKHS